MFNGGVANDVEIVKMLNALMTIINMSFVLKFVPVHVDLVRLLSYRLFAWLYL